MTFPTTSILDDFNRSNEGPPPSGSWSTPSLIAGCKVVSNECVSDASGAAAFAVYNTDYGPDSEVYYTIADKGADDLSFGLLLRGLQTGAANTADGYWLQITTKSGTDIWTIGTLDNGVFNNIGSGISQEYSIGDKVGFEVIGTTLKAYIDTGGGWSQVGSSETDGTYTIAGKIGIYLGDDAKELDDFGGGTVVVSGISVPVSWHHLNKNIGR